MTGGIAREAMLRVTVWGLREFADRRARSRRCAGARERAGREPGVRSPAARSDVRAFWISRTVLEIQNAATKGGHPGAQLRELRAHGGRHPVAEPVEERSRCRPPRPGARPGRSRTAAASRSRSRPAPSRSIGARRGQPAERARRRRAPGPRRDPGSRRARGRCRRSRATGTAVVALAEPVDLEDPRHAAGRAQPRPDRQPVRPVVGHVVAAERAASRTGSRRSSPTVPSAAAVRSDEIVAPKKTPCSQSRASATRGTLVARRPPKMIASMTTPRGSSQSSEMDGHWAAATVKRELGWAAGVPDAGVQSCPVQSTRWSGGLCVSPSHQTSPSSRRATLVKIVLPHMVSTAVALVDGAGAGRDAEEPGLGVDRAQLAVGARREPGDVVADGLDVPAGDASAAASRSWSCRTRSGTRRRRGTRGRAGWSP